MGNSNRKDADILAEVYANSRVLTMWYLGKLKGTDPYFQPVLGEGKGNSWGWLVGHLIYTENALLRTGLGFERMDLPWTKFFKMGSDGILTHELPEPKELIATMKESHELALEGIRTLENAELDIPIEGAFLPFLNSKRNIIMHAIRHESIHAGHLGWVNSAMGITTI